MSQMPDRKFQYIGLFKLSFTNLREPKDLRYFSEMDFET